MATAATTSDAAPKAAWEEQPAMPHALMLVLRGLDDAGLRREFDKHADKDKDTDRRMSKAGLASFMRDKGLAHGDADVERAMERVDTSKDGDIDYGEFCSLSQATSYLEKVLQAKCIESILCYYFPKDQAPRPCKDGARPVLRHRKKVGADDGAAAGGRRSASVGCRQGPRRRGRRQVQRRAQGRNP